MSSTWERLFGRRPEPGANDPPRGASAPDPEEELEQQLRGAEIPPRALSEEEAWVEGGGWWSGFASSNVRALMYDQDTETLTVEYGRAGQPSTFWQYTPVRVAQAHALYRAPSKGTWLWDNVRVRGTVHEHQVEASRFSAL